jgi:hypothetical protein
MVLQNLLDSYHGPGDGLLAQESIWAGSLICGLMYCSMHIPGPLGKCLPPVRIQ